MSDGPLSAILADPDRRRRFVDDGVALIDREVASKGGIGGLALKTGYAAIGKVRPGIVREALDMLLPAFAPALEPHVVSAQASGDIAGWFAAHADLLADAMLAVTDRKADHAANPVVKRTYAGLRGQARAHTVAAMPGVGQLVAAHLGGGAAG